MDSMEAVDAYNLSVLADRVNADVFATIRANLQRPDIQADAQALFGHVPKSVRDLAEEVVMYLLSPNDSKSMQ